MSIQGSYNRWSSTYDTDENLTRDLDEVVSRDTLGDMRCKLILEIGCGTGKNTTLLAQIGEEVHAIDFSEGMLVKAKEKLGSSNVTFSVADITKPWPFAAGIADLIVCNLVLEHVEDLCFVFSEAFRSLIEGGSFYISELHPFRQYQGVKARFQGDQGVTEIQAFVHHISDFLDAAEESGLRHKDLGEWWHEEDQDKLPRLVSFMFEK
ncbi:MAG: methyltransferase domain-containing protein [Anaerolineales bacterium]|nr:methyltransferase domain-containing protein [Anaerolineales bacterium]